MYSSFLFIFILILIVILIFILMNKINVIQKESVSCYNTRFGCCQDKYTTKQNIHGSNCRGF